jgi:hypothetical protein
MEATKSAINAVENDVKLEEANLFAEDERRLTKERESILDDEHIEMETISRDSIETGRVDSLLGSEYDFQRMQQFNKFLEERNGRGIIRGRSSEEIASVRFSSFVSNELDAKASGVYNELNGIERREVGIEENILKEQLVDQASREADKFEVEVAQSIKKGERTADQKFMDTLKFEGDF